MKNENYVLFGFQIYVHRSKLESQQNIDCFGDVESGALKKSDTEHKVCDIQDLLPDKAFRESQNTVLV